MTHHGNYLRGAMARRSVLAAGMALILGVAVPGTAVPNTAALAQSVRSAPADTSADATSATSIKVLAAHSVVHGLALALIRDSGIVLERAAPANLPPTRMVSYFAGRGAKPLTRAASAANAVIGMRSIWPDDPLYPMARRSNIRIVEIDAARPVDGALPGIALRADSDARDYPWLNPVNLGRMADIIAADLERLAPAAKPVLQAKLAAFKRELVSLAADAETQFAELDDVSVASLSERLDYLVSGLNLDMALRDARPDGEWDAQALRNFGDAFKTLGVKVVLHHREPAVSIRQAIEDAGGRLVVLDTDQEDPLVQLRTMVQALRQAFQP